MIYSRQLTTRFCAIAGGKRANSSAILPQARKPLNQIKKAAQGDFAYHVISALLMETSRSQTPTSRTPYKHANSSAIFPQARKSLEQIKKAAQGDFAYHVISALLVAASGIEPLTSCAPCKHANSLAIFPEARKPLEQIKKAAQGDFDYRVISALLVEVSGIEPLTSCMPCKRSPS